LAKIIVLKDKNEKEKYGHVLLNRLRGNKFLFGVELIEMKDL